jgi:hypothetical protein
MSRGSVEPRLFFTSPLRGEARIETNRLPFCAGGGGAPVRLRERRDCVNELLIALSFHHDHLVLRKEGCD